MVTYFHSLSYFLLAFKFTVITNNQQRQSIIDEKKDI